MSTGEAMTRLAIFMGGRTGLAFHAWFRRDAGGSRVIADGCCNTTVKLVIAA